MKRKVHPLVKQLGISEKELEQEFVAVMQTHKGEIKESDSPRQEFKVDDILGGRVVRVMGNEVVIDVGFKSEGLVDLHEFDTEPKPGERVEVLLESIEADDDLIELSKKKADRIRGWERIVKEKKEGDLVSGTITRKIKGGLLVDIGVPVFLPASQVDIRRTGDIAEFIGRKIDAKILKIDEQRRNIVVSRRKLLEEDREVKRRELLTKISEGDVVRGVVKNIADFGAFIDLGGLDGLLHITDMSWSRINHPMEMLAVGDKVDVKILSIDMTSGKISLGLKQTTENPWEKVPERYPVGTKVRGEVVNIMNYGAFVKLEDGIEGLVHVSEMSWTKRVNHPSEIVSLNDEIECVVLGINPEKQEISLGMKQIEDNPWDTVNTRFPVNSRVRGKIRNMTTYGAFVELDGGIDGLLHLSDISWTRKYNHPNEIFKKGDEIEAVVLNVDQEKHRVALGVKQLDEDPWDRQLPEKYMAGSEHTGRITKITNFGVFVELEECLEGLLHQSEIQDKGITDIERFFAVGDEIDVEILKLDKEDRKIALGYVGKPEERAEEASAETPAAPSAGATDGVAEAE